jgi:hypothetical protein|tara:strand:+ start:407 stop:658 length:252 start_codon:yes stop_codon:yes gene_type:complete
MSVIKLLGSEAAIATASNVGLAKLVRVLNNSGGVQLITQKNAGGTTIGTVSIYAYDCIEISKASTDTLTGAATSLAVAIAFAN